jgi:hypothetical protein
MDSKFLIIDDIVSLETQEKIKNTLLGDSFPWFYVDDVTISDEISENTPAMKHYYRVDYKTNSQFYSLVEDIGDKGAELYGFDYTNVSQVRSFLQFPLNPNWRKVFVDKLHIDSTSDHLVVLYYVLNSDGDTIIVNKKMEFEEHIPNDVPTDLKYTDYEVLHRITPKQGRAVIFNGKYYHTAEQPTNGIRCVINFNLV